MFILLTSKLGEYNSEPDTGLTVVKTYDYYFYDKKKAAFDIARIDSESARVNITETGDNGTRNSIPIKFFESFHSIQEAEKELEHLAGSKIMKVALKERHDAARSA